MVAMVPLRCSNRACTNGQTAAHQASPKLLGYVSSTGSGVLRLRCPRCHSDNAVQIGAGV